jgi:hypothetical protein
MDPGNEFVTALAKHLPVQAMHKDAGSPAAKQAWTSS